jgi:membrane protease YdiL (CAAX protease family)
MLPVSIQNQETTGQQHGVPVQREGAVSGRRLLLALGTWIALSVALGVVTMVILKSVAQTWTATSGPAVLIVAEVYLALPVTFLLTFGGLPGLRDRLRFRYTSARDLLLALGVWVVSLVAVALVYVALSPLLGSPQDVAIQVLRSGTDLSHLSAADALTMGLIVVRVCLLAGLGEELLFRGALYGWLRSRLSAVSTILLTSVIFAAIHTQFVPFSVHTTLLLLPLTMPFGIVAGWIRERTGSTLNCFMLHIATDTLMFVAAYTLVAQHVVR